MFTNTQDIGKEVSAGLVMRARRQTRSWPWSWGRGKKKFSSVADAETERPWAGVAEWLRVAHSLLDDKTAELTRNPE